MRVDETLGARTAASPPPPPLSPSPSSSGGAIRTVATPRARSTAHLSLASAGTRRAHSAAPAGVTSAHSRSYRSPFGPIGHAPAGGSNAAALLIGYTASDVTRATREVPMKVPRGRATTPAFAAPSSGATPASAPSRREKKSSFFSSASAASTSFASSSSSSSSAKCSWMASTSLSASSATDPGPKDALTTPVGFPSSSRSTPSPHVFPDACRRRARPGAAPTDSRTRRGCSSTRRGPRRGARRARLTRAYPKRRPSGGR